MTTDNRIGVVILTLVPSPSTAMLVVPEEHLLVLEGIHTADRPAAVGYFILDVMRDAFRKYGNFPESRFRIGTVDHNQLKMRKAQGYNVRTSEVRGGVPGDILGEMYKLVIAVERGDQGLLNS